MGPEDLERVRAVMSRAPEAPRRASLTWADLRGALACFLLVFLSTLPVALPFALVTDLHRALRISNGIAIALLFVAGYSLGQWAGFRPWVTGLVLVLLGVMLSAATIALGG
jgi:VIT1/CCC1 family predicted Fe2+/Mn2+ transporter